MLLEVGMILVAIGIIMMAWGYNLTLAGYSRKKMLEGISVQTQMYRRQHIGNELMKVGIITTAVSAFLIFVMFGLLLTVETTKIYPEKVDIITAQGRTVVIADGKVYKFAGAHYHIKRVRLERELNIYGFECLGSIPKLVIETKDRWERLEQ
jgi:hypothetical protein